MVGMPVSRGRLKFASILSQILLAAPLVLLAFVLGGARPWLSGTTAALFFLGFVVLLWVSPRFPLSPVSRTTCILTGLALGFLLFQVIPLPQSWLSVLSPIRFLWLRSAEQALNATVPSASLSYKPLATFMYWIYWVFLVCYAWLLKSVIEEKTTIPRLLNLLLIVAGIEGLYGLVQVLLPGVGVVFGGELSDFGQGLARGTFINKNHYADFLGMILPFLLARIFMLREESVAGTFRRNGSNAKAALPLQVRKAILMFVTAMVFLAIASSQSRGGIIGAVIGITVFGLWSKIHGKMMVTFIITAWILCLGYGYFFGIEKTVDRFENTSSDFYGRFTVWLDTMDIVRDHPWTGVGAGSYRSVIRLYQAHQEKVFEDIEMVYAHNDYVQILAESGILVGGAIILFVWGYWWKTAWRLWKRLSKEETGLNKNTDPFMDRHLVAVAALAAGAAFLCHCWVEFNFETPVNQLFFIVSFIVMGAFARTIPASPSPVRVS